MKIKFTKKLILQYACIVIGAFGIIASFVYMFDTHWRNGRYEASNFTDIIRGIYTILFCGALILVEIIIFPFFKYFGFLMKTGGKALMYLFVGALLFGVKGFSLFCGILYWALAVIFAILAFFVKTISPPLLQGGLKGNPPQNLDIDANDFYEDFDGTPKSRDNSILNTEIME